MTQFSVFLPKTGLEPMSLWTSFGGFVMWDPPCPSLCSWASALCTCPSAFADPPSSLHLRGRQKQHCLINYLRTAAIRKKKNIFLSLNTLHQEVAQCKNFPIICHSSMLFFFLWKDSKGKRINGKISGFGKWIQILDLPLIDCKPLSEWANFSKSPLFFFGGGFHL